jgi:hypothetical protein
VRTAQVEKCQAELADGFARGQIDFGIDTYGRVYASINKQSGSDLQYCYGIDAGYKTFVKAYAPYVVLVFLHR